VKMRPAYHSPNDGVISVLITPAIATPDQSLSGPPRSCNSMPPTTAAIDAAVAPPESASATSGLLASSSVSAQAKRAERSTRTAASRIIIGLRSASQGPTLHLSRIIFVAARISPPFDGSLSAIGHLRLVAGRREQRTDGRTSRGSHAPKAHRA